METGAVADLLQASGTADNKAKRAERTGEMQPGAVGGPGEGISLLDKLAEEEAEEERARQDRERRHSEWRTAWDAYLAAWERLKHACLRPSESESTEAFFRAAEEAVKAVAAALKQRGWEKHLPAVAKEIKERERLPADAPFRRGEMAIAKLLRLALDSGTPAGTIAKELERLLKSNRRSIGLSSEVENVQAGLFYYVLNHPTAAPKAASVGGENQPGALDEIAERRKAEISAEQRRQKEQADEATKEQEFLDTCARVNRSRHFAILHTDRHPDPDQFFREGEQRFRDFGKAITCRGWDKYLPRVIQRIQEAPAPQSDAQRYFAELLIVACNPESPPGEIAGRLKVAAGLWPEMQDDFASNMRVCLSTLHQNGGEYPPIKAPPKDPAAERQRKATAGARMFDLIQKDPTTHTWTCRQFQERLGYKSPSTITDTAAWKGLAVARESARLQRAEKAYKKGLDVKIDKRRRPKRKNRPNSLGD